jgi:hypothetical protein
MKSLSFLVVVALCCAIATAKYVTFSNCTDKVTCQKSTCQQQTLPVDSCIPNGGSGSQTLTCIPYATLYLSKFKFTDKECKTAPFDSELLNCDRCFPINSTVAKFASPRCLISDAGVAMVNVSLCEKETNPQNCGCNDPLVAAQWVAGQCQAADGGQNYEMLNGYEPCANVLQQVYTTPDCTGSPIQNLLPSGTCASGSFIRCHGDY